MRILRLYSHHPQDWMADFREKELGTLSDEDFESHLLAVESMKLEKVGTRGREMKGMEERMCAKMVIFLTTSFLDHRTRG